jgi:hypothetical protein
MEGWCIGRCLRLGQEMRSFCSLYSHHDPPVLYDDAPLFWVASQDRYISLLSFNTLSVVFLSSALDAGEIICKGQME